MKPELDDEAAPRETGLPVYNARFAGILLVLGLLNTLLIVAAARLAYFLTDLPIARGLQSLAPLSLSRASSITADRPCVSCCSP
jgi:hypothetical protein